MRTARATIAGFGLMRMPGERSVPVVDRGGGWRGRGTLPRSRVRPAHVSFGSLPEPVHRRPSGRSRTGFGHDHRFVETAYPEHSGLGWSEALACYDAAHQQWAVR